MYNRHDKNIRRYPNMPTKDVVLALSGFTIANKNPLREDGWESIDTAVGERWVGNNIDDENDWGGLDNIDKEDKKSTSYRTAEYYSSLFKPEMDKFTWFVHGHLAAGPHPFFFSFEKDLSFLKKAGFKAILTCYDEPLDQEHLDDFQYYFMPTEDGKTCNLLAACKFIDKMIQNDKPVFIHSFSGNGRAGTILAAYAVYKNWLTTDEAISYIRLNYNKVAIETQTQEAALHAFGLTL